MGNVWEMYGKCMGNVWEMYGKCMVKCMGTVWETYAIFMANVWEMYGAGGSQLYVSALGKKRYPVAGRMSAFYLFLLPTSEIRDTYMVA